MRPAHGDFSHLHIARGNRLATPTLNMMSINMSGIPTRGDVFELGAADEKLQPFLSVNKPDSAQHTPPILSFRRQRRVEIPWDTILGGVATKGITSVAAIREYFERSWGIEPGEVDEALLSKLASDSCVVDVDPDHPVYRTNFDKPSDLSSAIAITTGIVLKHGTSGRLYLVETEPDQTLNVAGFTNTETYISSWDRVIGVELVFATSPEANTYYTDFDELDLRPAIIHRRYKELDILHRHAREINSKVKGGTEAILQKAIDDALEPTEIERIQRRYLQLEMQEYDAHRMLEQLVHRAAGFGYSLFLKDGKVKFPDRQADVKKGELYTKYRRIASWTTQHSRVRFETKTLWFIPLQTVKHTTSFTRQHSKYVEDYQLFDTSVDQVAKKEAELREEGMEVFILDRTTAGFVTSEGITLRSLMARCAHNEAFRRNCVVLLPVYEESLTGQRALAKYSVFKRPLPGISPTTFPRLSLQESLSYRSAWIECQLGELVSSINLAPGEQRTIDVTRTFERETNVTKSSTSIFEISQADTTDLATEMESQARQESEQSSNFQMNASVQGGNAFVTAEASASGGTSASLKEFGQAIHKVAKKAAQSINQQSREEVSSSTTTTTSVSSSDTTTATVRNINEGRSLNLLFYRLNNKFEGGLYLEDLQFNVISGVEIIAGSGIHESVVFGLGDVRGMLEEFDDRHLPFDLDESQRADYLEAVLDAVTELLEREYGAPPETRYELADFAGSESHPGEDGLGPAGSTESVGVVQIAEPALRSFGQAEMAGDSNFAARLDEITRLLKNARIRDLPMGGMHELLVASRGLYLDTIVGVRPSTEPYSEEMRRQEIRMRAADVFVKESEGILQRAQAEALNNKQPSNWLIDLLAESGGKTISLSLRFPLRSGDWSLVFDGESQAEIRPEMIGRFQVQHSWPERQDWLDDVDLARKIELRDNESDVSIRFQL